MGLSMPVATPPQPVLPVATPPQPLSLLATPPQPVLTKQKCGIGQEFMAL